MFNGRLLGTSRESCLSDFRTLLYGLLQYSSNSSVSVSLLGLSLYMLCVVFTVKKSVFSVFVFNLERSEHERHSPNCPFVKGEHTQNVPLSVTLATSPAQFPCTDGTDRITCFGSGSCPHFLAAATKRGKICIWDVSKLMKVCNRNKNFSSPLY